MGDIEEKIPVFSTWKMFNETIIPTLLNIDYSELYLEKLTHIVTAQQFSNIFTYSHNPLLSFEEFKEVSRKYKAFTLWFLGRFFYLLSCDSLIKMHDLITDTQLKILDKFCITQPCIYEELSAEYSSIFSQLNDYHRNLAKTPDLKVTLKLFVIDQCEDLKANLDLSSLPLEIDSESSCYNVQKKIIKFIHRITAQNIELYYFNQITYDNMDNLLYVLAECNLDLKLLVLEAVMDLLKTHEIDSNSLPPKFVEKCKTSISYIEPFIYDIYNRKIKASDKQLQVLEKILTDVLKSSSNLIKGNAFQRISIFVSSRTSNENLQNICVDRACSIRVPSKLKNVSIDECVRMALEDKKYSLFQIVKKQILEEICENVDLYMKSNLYTSEFNTTWTTLSEKIVTSLASSRCNGNYCKFQMNLEFFLCTLRALLHLKLQAQTKGRIVWFFDEPDILTCMLNIVDNHIEGCGHIPIPKDIEELLQEIFILLPTLYVVKDFKIIFHCIAFPFIKRPGLVCHDKPYAKSANKILSYLANCNDGDKQISARNLCKLMCNISANFVTVDEQKDKQYLMLFNLLESIKSCIMESNDMISNDILRFPSIYSSDKVKWFREILMPCLQIEPLSETIIQSALDFICKSYSQYIEVLLYDSVEYSTTLKTFCLSCMHEFHGLDGNEVTKLVQDKLPKMKDYEKYLCVVSDVFPAVPNDSQSILILDDVLKILLEVFKGDNEENKLILIRNLCALSHIQSFHTIKVVELWLPLLSSPNKRIRSGMIEVIAAIMEDIQQHKNLHKLYKKEVLEICFTKLKELTKSSLKNVDLDLQDAVLEAIEKLSMIQAENVILFSTRLLLYFIMVPTSKYPLIAVNIFIEMAAHHNSTTDLIYLQHRKEICRMIVQLCALNQVLLNYNLADSLRPISLVLSFFGPKDFITQECRYLLPFFIALVIRFPNVEKLISEVATFVEVNSTELLINRYKNIFVHLYLNETEDNFKRSMNYIEKRTEMSSIALRKPHLQFIIKELLLNFHEKRDRVLSALTILAREDLDLQTFNAHEIPEYLQPKLLGVLVHFDIKLIAQHSDKKKVLLSLAQLLRFMGPKHVTPLRFKILAMLKTVPNNRNDDVFPELNCDAWDAFVRNCEIDALGPQLASIFVSLLPLLPRFPKKIGDIFRYLIVENEIYLKDYIPDLFFVVEMDIDNEMCLIIKKHLQPFERRRFAEQLKTFLKYLSHETVDVRVHGLRYLKRLLEKNREELDRMVLGYNGIDPAIVELIDVLVLGSRKKEESLKLACGECIGELGAVEPSHLPREYTQESKSFTFSIEEDACIVGALNELTKALQAEKNTQNIDRFSLAIQEILKVYEISPDSSSSKHGLWKNFSDAQHELMLPLLSSKYAMVQSIETIDISPIYGSKFGATFQTWIYNWTCSLILSIKSHQRTLLQACLPSLKQDHRILMYFLPHILLHVLIENDPAVHQKIHEEFIAVINYCNSKQQLKPVVQNIGKLSGSSSTSLSVQTITTEEARESQCTKVVFVLLDFLDRWVREWIWEKKESASGNEDCRVIKEFLSRFSKFQLAHCNYLCGEYPRALMYLEEFTKLQPEDLNSNFAFLSELYAQLNEPDGVAGVMALQTTDPPLEQRLLALEVSGKLAEAAACYERIHPPLKPHHIQGLVQCYLDLDNVNTALNFAKGAIERQPEYKNILFEIQAEPLWRLSRYSELDSLLQKPELSNNSSWGVHIGQALLHLKNGNRDEFKMVLNGLRTSQVESLGAASLQEGAYLHGYSYIARLHAINELQQVERTVYELLARPNASERIVKQLASEWELRLKVVQESVRIQEPILCLRRVALEQAKDLLHEKVPHSLPLINSLLGELWLHSGKTARAANVHQQAYTYTLKAEEYAPPRLFLEKAKLHWLREEHEQALTTLCQGLEKLLPDGLSSPSSSLTKLSVEDKKIAAEAKLLIATYNDSISNVDTDINTHHYKKAVEVFPEWEKSMVCLAQYFDRIFHTYSDNDKDARGSEIQVNMIVYFGKSLLYGSSYVYQSMPRMLSIWFDYGTRLLDVANSSVKAERTTTLLNMTKIIDTFLERLPSYIFLTAFSQLVSRICHPQKQVYIELKSIIIKLILQYPQQSLWMIMSVIKSGYTVRSKRCAEILNDSHLRTPSLVKLVGDFTKLAEKLIELCNKDISENVQVASVNNLLRTLPRLLTKDDFSEIMIPTQKFRKLILPNPDFQSSQHNPFPNHYVHIVGIEDEVTILQSLQKPRRITFRGSDGKLYIQMLKPKDDLRKDFRLMEFNDIVNQLLSREADSRQRRLDIRVYSVVPLNEECGLIEWVPNLIGLRPILLTLYKQIGMGMKGKELKQMCYNQRDPLIKKREVFTKVFLPRHPPVLGEWFRKTFPDAQSWLTARTAYIRTTAVISMVGYVLGLGDRHGENILFDSTCGDTIHVDFNCLFNKGETFEWPERVPFRLTQNMVNAMGPLGVEGIFRKSCACTLRVLRMNSNTLMSIVTPFVYDPLVSWHKNSLANAQVAERTNEQAVEHIRNIESRLQGKVRTKGRSFSIPLSVEGQTNNIIQEAMSVDNLCQMYIGWGPYL